MWIGSLMTNALKSQNLALCVFVCGFVLNLVGFFSPYWFHVAYTGYGHSQGLWRWCILWPVFPQCTKMNVQQAWFQEVQALEVLGLVSSVISLTLISVFKLSTKFKMWWVTSLIVSSCVLAACSELLGIAYLLFWLFFLDNSVFTTGDYSMTFFTRADLSWACLLTLLGAALYSVAGWLMNRIYKVF